jgi:hypothetical protein
VIVSLHVGIGAAAGALTRSRSAAVLLCPPLHLIADGVPHEDIPDRRFEIGSGLFCLGLLAGRRGPLDPVVLGAASSAAPDLEHLVPWLRPRGRTLFHRRAQRGGGVPARVQVLLAGAIVGWLLCSHATSAAGRDRR